MFVVFGLTRISLFVVFGLTRIPRISLNCIDDVKSHRIVWWESEWGVYLFVWGLCVLIFFVFDFDFL